MSHRIGTEQLARPAGDAAGPTPRRSALTSAKNALDRVLSWVCVVLFAALVLDVMWQVFTRQVLDAPSAWSEELAKYLFIWLGLLGSALVFGERGHVGVELLVQKAPPAVQRVLSLTVQTTILLFAVVALAWGGWQVVDIAWDQKVTGLPFNVGQLYLALPICGVLTAAYTLYHIVRIARGDEPPYEPDAEVETV
ncbi:TRAP transporter small permease [Kineococcus glutinatus]|uniref:TRAP transporter small permease n=1 Tax=Kineococcus glutinatus TaxID=1070872 RepID=A0ABP9HAB6_9ACTN